jgi:hypothetical protein
LEVLGRIRHPDILASNLVRKYLYMPDHPFDGILYIRLIRHLRKTMLLMYSKVQNLGIRNHRNTADYSILIQRHK